MRYVFRLIGVVCFSLAVIQTTPARAEAELRPGQEFREEQDLSPSALGASADSSGGGHDESILSGSRTIAPCHSNHSSVVLDCWRAA